MPMSDYMRGLRALVGTTVLEVPTVSVVVHDAARRVLLVRHAEGGDWTTPGGMIEPYEIPADAALRETWEETGLLVELAGLIGVFGGRLCASTYANGDTLSWVATVFGARVLAGTPRPDGVETLDVRWFARDDVARVRCKPHVALFLDAAWSSPPTGHFQPATWRPPAAF
jgi:8-oxo-dGTP pyrophosphatase MutT (NUDIX family)